MHFLISAAQNSMPWGPWGAVASNVTLGGVTALIYKEYRDEKARKEELYKKLMEEVIPILTKATTALESVLRRQEIREISREQSGQ